MPGTWPGPDCPDAVARVTPNLAGYHPASLYESLCLSVWVSAVPRVNAPTRGHYWDNCWDHYVDDESTIRPQYHAMHEREVTAMSEVESATTELKTQYAAQVAADLERNAKEQERIGAEADALQEQLHALRHDQALLANLQETLGTQSPAQAEPGAEADVTATPSLPRQATAESKPRKRKKAAAPKPRKTAAAKSPDPKASTPSAQQSTLVELIRNHLGHQSEPRSSAEITTALTQTHPDRDIKPKVVRTTVEGLVAKGRVHRTKQGSSVFYTAADNAPADTPAADASSEQEPATT